MRDLGRRLAVTLNQPDLLDRQTLDCTGWADGHPVPLVCEASFIADITLAIRSEAREGPIRFHLSPTPPWGTLLWCRMHIAHLGSGPSKLRGFGVPRQIQGVANTRAHASRCVTALPATQLAPP